MANQPMDVHEEVAEDKSGGVIVPPNIRKIIFINTSGGLPVNLMSKAGDEFYGTQIIRDRITEICLCNPEFRDAIRCDGLRINPAHYFGAYLKHITTPLDPNTMYIYRYDRIKKQVGEVRTDFEQTSIPSLKDLASVQVRTFDFSWNELRTWLSEELADKIRQGPRKVQELWDFGYDEFYNCVEIIEYVEYETEDHIINIIDH